MSKKILIIEDELAMSKALSKKFRDNGFDTFIAKNGKIGLDIALELKPDLILLDIIMPKMDGIEMLNKLRKDSWGENVPVILLSNLNDSEKIKKALKIGIHDYLLKSDWKLNDILKKVQERLSL